MKKLTIILTLVLLSVPNVFLATNYVNAQSVKQVLSDIENERTKKLQETLGLTIPLETDNPNHILTFKDPSGKGVKLEIDGQGYKTIKSPYTLPSLGIGSHVLSFKFVDKEETNQTLEKDLVVIPRPPILNAPSKVTKSEITISGTSLAGSTVDLFLSGDTLNFKAQALTGTDGNWSHTFKESFKFNVYTIIARTKKNGFSSNLSEPVVFELNTQETANSIKNEPKPIYFDLRQFTPSNTLQTLKDNPHLLIVILLSLVFGGLITWWLESLSSRKVNKTAEGKFIQLLSEKDKQKKENEKAIEKSKDKLNKPIENTDINDKKLTLKEKFEKAGFKLQKEEVKEKTISKEQFLEEFKQEDPDDIKGKEKKEEKVVDEKKKVAVTLTSKKKE